jgi:DNA-binding NtrC family response regulator
MRIMRRTRGFRLYSAKMAGRGEEAEGGETEAVVRKRVLLVDDDPDVLRALRRGLLAYADVEVALGAEPAMSLLEREKFDVAIVDFNMNGPNGAWLLRRIRDRDQSIVRILLSGSAYSELAVHLEPGLVHSFVEKPFVTDELFELF